MDVKESVHDHRFKMVEVFLKSNYKKFEKTLACGWLNW